MPVLSRSVAASSSVLRTRSVTRSASRRGGRFQTAGLVTRAACSAALVTKKQAWLNN